MTKICIVIPHMPLNGYLHVTSISVNLSNLLIDQISLMLTYENTKIAENTFCSVRC